MPLPWLKVKHQSGLIVNERKSDHLEEEDEKSQDHEGLESCAGDIIRCIVTKDPKGLAQALKDAFAICDSAPHDEGEHTNDYDSMNELAAKEDR